MSKKKNKYNRDLIEEIADSLYAMIDKKERKSMRKVSSSKNEILANRWDAVNNRGMNLKIRGVEEPLDIQRTIKEACESLRGGRFMSIEDHCEIQIDPQDKLRINVTDLSMYEHIMQKYVRNNSTVTPTIVMPTTYGGAGVWQYTASGIDKRIWATSTYPSIGYKSIEKWTNLLRNSKNMTCALYIPGCVFFQDASTGEIINPPRKFNVLMVSMPKNPFKMITEGEEGEKKLDKSPVHDYIMKILEIAVRMQLKDLIIDPIDEDLVEYAEEYEDCRKREVPHYIASAWKNIIALDRYKKNIDSIDFCITNDDDLATFNAVDINCAR